MAAAEGIEAARQGWGWVSHKGAGGMKVVVGPGPVIWAGGKQGGGPGEWPSRQAPSSSELPGGPSVVVRVR